LEAATFERLPPSILVVGTLDPVADDVRSYARLLREAGNEVELHELPGMFHGAFVTTEALPARLGAALLERSS
jgi:acetyl esterase